MPLSFSGLSYNLGYGSLQQTNKQVLSKWEVINPLFHKILMVNPTTVVYPWQSSDASNSPPICLTSTAFSFFAHPTYVPRLVSHKWLDNYIWHQYLFLRSTAGPAQIVEQLGPWLQATKQGLWPQQLPLTKQTIGLITVFCTQIWFERTETATTPSDKDICCPMILPHQHQSLGQGNKHSPPHQSVHLKADQVKMKENWRNLFNFLSKAQNFPFRD